MIPNDMRTMGVMLASPGKNPDVLLAQLLREGGRWTYDVKEDGIRALVYTEDGKAWLRSRQGEDLTQYPEVIAYLQETFPTESMVFDAEIICVDPQLGRPTFNRVQIRNAQSNRRAITTLSLSHPATLAVFDMLCDRGVDLRKVMQQGRRLLLERTAERFDNQRMTLNPASDDGAMMWELVHKHNLEGLIAKNKAGLYVVRRSPSWVKMKPVQSLTAVAYDWEPGKKDGARANTIGAIFVGLVDGQSFSPIGHVGTGFTMKELAALEVAINAWKADPATAPPVLVEIEYQQLTESGKMRFPSYKHRRTDITFEACSVAQLPEPTTTTNWR